MKYLSTALASLALLASASQVSGSTPAKSDAARVGLVPADSKLLIVFVNPVPGQEVAFNAWYDEHMRAFMKFPNFVRVQKFKMLSRKGKPDPKFQYVFIFEFKGDQDASFAQVQAAMKDGRLQMPDHKIVGTVEGMNYAADGVGYRGPAAE